MTESDVQFYAGNLVMALEHLHTRGIAYRSVRLPPPHCLRRPRLRPPLSASPSGAARCELKLPTTWMPSRPPRPLCVCVRSDLKSENVLLSGGFTHAAAGWPVLVMTASSPTSPRSIMALTLHTEIRLDTSDPMSVSMISLTG